MENTTTAVYWIYAVSSGASGKRTTWNCSSRPAKYTCVRYISNEILPMKALIFDMIFLLYLESHPYPAHAMNMNGGNRNKYLGKLLKIGTKHVTTYNNNETNTMNPQLTRLPSLIDGVIHIPMKKNIAR